MKVALCAVALVDCVDGPLELNPVAIPMPSATSVPADASTSSDAAMDAYPDVPVLPDLDAAFSDAPPPACGYCDPPDAAFASIGCGLEPVPLDGAGASILEGAPLACCLAAIMPQIVIDPGGATDHLGPAAIADPGIYACCTLVVAWVGTGGLGVPPDVDAACCYELGSPTVQGCSPWGPPVPPAFA
jgi:hypothetical protein